MLASRHQQLASDTNTEVITHNQSNKLRCTSRPDKPAIIRGLGPVWKTKGKYYETPSICQLFIYTRLLAEFPFSMLRNDSIGNYYLSLILTTNQKRKYFEKYLAFSQASWSVSAIFFVKEMKNNRKKRKYLHIFSRKDRPLIPALFLGVFKLVFSSRPNLPQY